jgi:hypothetical protein
LTKDDRSLTMAKHRLVISCLALFTLLLVSGVYAQNEVTTDFAGVREGTIYVYHGTEVAAEITNPPNKGIFSLAWSPDGSKLAYIMSDENFQARVWVVDAQGGTPVMLEAAGQSEVGFPVTFTPDGAVLYVQAGTNAANPTPEYRVNLNRITPEAGAQPETLGSVIFGVGCGGGSIIPADWQYWAESGFGGNYQTLLWTDYGVLHSITCGGSGLALFDPEVGEDKYLTPITMTDFGMPQPDENIGRTALASDGKTLAAVKIDYVEPAPINSLVFVDLETGTITDQVTTGQPEQLAWANDGTLYYTTREVSGDLLADLTPEQRQVFETMGFLTSVDSYKVDIRHLNPATGEDDRVYTADAYQIGRLRVAADDSVWFSQIANLKNWVEGIANGTLDLAADMDGSQQRALVPVSVYRLDPASGQNLELMADHLSQFILWSNP